MKHRGKCIPPGLSPSSRMGFTLIEVMVSVGIMALLLGVFLSVSDYASQAWKRSQEKMENFSKSRVVLNRIRADLETIVMRKDLPLFPVTSGTTALGFMTSERSVLSGTTSTPRLLSYVEYAWVTTGTSADLNRSTFGYPMYTSSSSDQPPFPAAASGTTSATPPPPSPLHTNLLVSGIVGFQVAFLNSDGTLTPGFNPYPSTPYSTAVRVSLLMVSSDGLKHLQDTGRLSTLVSNVNSTIVAPDSAKPSPEMAWNDYIRANAASIDPKTLRSLYSFERLFFLPNLN